MAGCCLPDSHNLPADHKDELSKLDSKYVQQTLRKLDDHLKEGKANRPCKYPHATLCNVAHISTSPATLLKPAQCMLPSALGGMLTFLRQFDIAMAMVGNHLQACCGVQTHDRV